MKEIPLSRGAVAIVDDKWYEYLNQWKWSVLSNGYAVRVEGVRTKQKMILMHRVVAGTPKGMYTDHMNRIRHDNRSENLRNCTNSQNNAYNGKRKNDNATSQYKGVSLDKRRGTWHVCLMKDYRHYHAGGFKEERHAAMAYDMWAKELFGEYARLNFNAINN